MALSTKFVKGVDDLATVKKLDPPLAKGMPNVQAFANSVDSAEKIEKDLEKLHKEAAKAIEEYNKVVAQFEKLEDAISKNGPVYDKALKTYMKQGRDIPDKAFMTGSNNVEAGLDEIEKGIFAIKKKYPEIKPK